MNRFIVWCFLNGECFGYDIDGIIDILVNGVINDDVPFNLLLSCDINNIGMLLDRYKKEVL